MKSTSIILANLMDSHGNINHETAARIDCAAAYDKKKESSLILLCGWAYRNDSEITIADAMHAYIKIKHTELASRAMCQRMSRDTVGDALFSRVYLDRIFRSSSYRVNVFTSDYHVERASTIFNFFFHGISRVSVFGTQGFASDDLKAKEMVSLQAFHNTFQSAPAGDAAYALAILREKHPFYNGQVHIPLVEIADPRLGLQPISLGQ